MNSIFLIFIGALATGLLQTVIGILDRRREAESILTAIASEVNAICRLIRTQEYKETVGAICSQIDSGTWDGRTVIIEVRQNYFAVFESLSSKIGLLEASDVNQIVHFYAYCRSAIDSTRPDGIMAGDVSADERISQLRHLFLVFDAILSLGDVISKKPRQDISAEPILKAQPPHVSR